jgi:hypothetical protein
LAASEKLIPAAEDRVVQCAETVRRLAGARDEGRRRFMELPRALRGYFDSHRGVFFVGASVVLFDAAVLHGILEYSGMMPMTVWLTSATVPLAIGATNHGLGVLAGAIGLRAAQEHRLRLAVVGFVAGVGALLIAFATLTVFRVEAADAQNAAIRAVAADAPNAQLTFFISPSWMGPLQVAGSFAAIAMTALWTIAKEGREVRWLEVECRHLAWQDAVEELRSAEREFEAAKRHREDTRAELESAALLEHRIEADAAAAKVEVDTSEHVLAASLASEDELAKTIQARYETAEQYFSQIYKNGDVWRMAMATVFPRWGRPYTPGSSDMAADDDVIEERHSRSQPRRRRLFGQRSRGGPNGTGRHPIDLDKLTKF